MDVRVEGPLAELKTVNYVGPCMQFWHSDAFQRRDNLTEFAGRCFLYTMRGPSGCWTPVVVRCPASNPTHRRTSPPCTQWYVPIGANASGRHLGVWRVRGPAPRGCRRRRLPGRSVAGGHRERHQQLRWVRAGTTASTTCRSYRPIWTNERPIVHRSMLYVMAQRQTAAVAELPSGFLERDRPCRRYRSRRARTRRCWWRHARGAHSGLDLSLDILGATGSVREAGCGLEDPSLGGFSCAATTRRACGPIRTATPWNFASALPVRPDQTGSKRRWRPGWKTEPAPKDVPALVRRSPDGAWIAALLWERDETGKPAAGVPAPGEDKAESLSVRGRLYLYRESPTNCVSVGSRLASNGSAPSRIVCP
jgi:hypothetical protein